MMNKSYEKNLAFNLNSYFRLFFFLLKNDDLFFACIFFSHFIRPCKFIINPSYLRYQKFDFFQFYPSMQVNYKFQFHFSPSSFNFQFCFELFDFKI